MPSTLVSTKVPQLSVSHILPCRSGQPTFSKSRVNWMAVNRRIGSSTQHYTTTSGFTPNKLGIRKGPSISNVHFKTDSSQADVFKEPKEKNFGWFLLRLPVKCDDLFTVTHDQQQIIPGWTPFNGQIQNTTDVPPPCNVGCCQTIDASPTELSTVHTVLQHSLAMADQLSQEDVIVVLDQAIYCKSKQIIWSVPEDYSRIVLRMGAFHICCNFLGILGKRFGEGGLGDLLIENGLVAAGSIASVLNGPHYNRAVRANKVVFEALLRMKWSNFRSWFAENPIGQFDQHTLCALLTTFQDDLSSEEFQTLLHSRDFSQALGRFSQL